MSGAVATRHCYAKETVRRRAMEYEGVAVAAHLGLPTTNVSSHSLRIGGASALAAAGADERDIMILWRWKSLIFLNYIRSSKLFSSRSMKLIVDPNSFTTLDVYRLSRGAA